MTRYEAKCAQYEEALLVLSYLGGRPGESREEALEAQEKLCTELAREADWLRKSPEGNLPARAA